jgi:hypothetical protein
MMIISGFDREIRVALAVCDLAATPADRCWWPRKRQDPETECHKTTILLPTGVNCLIALRARLSACNGLR